MIRVGVIDTDPSLVEAMSELWSKEISVGVKGEDSGELKDLDLLIVDPTALRGHSRRFLHQVRDRYPALKLILTFVYCDTIQAHEEEMYELADACILKPYDLLKLEKTVRFLVERGRPLLPESGGST